MEPICLPEGNPAIGEGLTFEKVWAAMQEGNRRMEAASEQVWEQLRETDRQLNKRFSELDRQIKETDRQLQETDRQLNKRFGELTNRFGEMVEYSVVPNLIAKFRELNFEFTKAHRYTRLADREHDIFTEVDAFLENGDKVMIVEIKTKPNTGDVDAHVERMEKLRAYADLRGDSRTYLGAIAGAVMSESIIGYALKTGFYVVEPSGDTFNIIEPSGKYHPRAW